MSRQTGEVSFNQDTQVKDVKTENQAEYLASCDPCNQMEKEIGTYLIIVGNGDVDTFFTCLCGDKTIGK